MKSLVDSFSLREINFAKTRLNILQVVMERILEKDFNKITIDEICKYAEISRGTFFNYFPTKNHILKYYTKIWEIRIGTEIEEDSFKNKTVKEKIKFLYEKVIEEEKKFPGLLTNYLKYILEVKGCDNEIKLTEVEFVYEFPNIHLYSSKIQELNKFSLKVFLKELLNIGVEQKEFKEGLDIEYTFLFLISIFFSPVIIDKIIYKSYDFEEYYNYSLNNLFENIKA